VEKSCSRGLLHVGDFDPSGESIFGSMAEDAAAFVDADRVIGMQYIEAERVALTADQVARYGLATAPATKSDSRSAKWQGETCQLEALAPDQLADPVDMAISARFDLERLEAQIRAEGRDRSALLRALPAGDAA
jgi:hypothetical protein